MLLSAKLAFSLAFLLPEVSSLGSSQVPLTYAEVAFSNTRKDTPVKRTASDRLRDVEAAYVTVLNERNELARQVEHLKSQCNSGRVAPEQKRARQDGCNSCVGCLHEGVCRDLVSFPQASKEKCESNKGTWCEG